MSEGTITIDGREIPFDKGDTIIMAARRAGIEIPHYCWHPGLRAPASCRMCLVEIEPPPGRPAMMLDILAWDDDKNDYTTVKKPKLMPACQMGCADGMVVHNTESKEVEKARAAVQELLLLNHPVDCPICDQAGECSLQDNLVEHYDYEKRMGDEPLHKVKAVPFSDDIVYDGERCIRCTRCIRISRDLAGDPVLSVRERGNHSEITVSQDRQLDHPYSLMTAHYCPVGALTATHFRFRARAWFLRSGPTLCQGCATGCNAYLDYDPRTNQPYRFRPRENAEVNQFWMCDEGMLSYPEAQSGRLLTALVGGDDATMQEGLQAAKKQLTGCADEPERTAIVLSARHSNEDNFALAVLGRQYLNATDFYVTGRPAGEGDDILISEDKNPNRAGVDQVAKLVGMEPPKPFTELMEKLTKDSYRYVIGLGSEIEVDGAEVRNELLRLKGVVAICSHDGPLSNAAHIALPACSFAEVAGTYVNKDGIAQRAEPVLEPLGSAYPAWQIVVALGRVMGFDIDWQSRSDLELAMVSAAPPEGAEEGADEAPAATEEVGS